MRYVGIGLLGHLNEGLTGLEVAQNLEVHLLCLVRLTLQILHHGKELLVEGGRGLSPPQLTMLRSELVVLVLLTLQLLLDGANHLSTLASHLFLLVHQLLCS